MVRAASLEDQTMTFTVALEAAQRALLVVPDLLVSDQTAFSLTEGTQARTQNWNSVINKQLLSVEL